MGYDTTFTLRVKGYGIHDRGTLHHILGWLKDHEIMGYALHDSRVMTLDDHICISGHHEVHWYGHEEDMLDMSMEFPTLTFCLHGEGEVPGDIWNKYFHDGEMEECHATFIMPEPKEIRWEDL